MDDEKAIKLLEECIKLNIPFAEKETFIKVAKTIVNSRKNDKKRIQELEEQLEKEQEKFRDYEKEVFHEINKIQCNTDKIAHEIMEEQSKKYNELKENGRAMIKAFAEYL